MLDKILLYLIRFLLSLRYRIRIKNLLPKDMRGPALILPNHPAEIDPVILSAVLWDSLPFQPITLEKFYHLPVLKILMKYISAIPIPDMSVSLGPNKLRRTKLALDQAEEVINRQGNILLYPSGMLSRGGTEKLRANSAVRTVLDRTPEVPIVLVRTSGLYGSLFSCATTYPHSPDLPKTLIKAALILLGNLIFFSPKREVLVELELAPADFPRSKSANEINRWLERWYNCDQKVHETKLLSHFFWKSELPKLPDIEANTEIDISDVSVELETSVKEFLADLSGVESDELKAKSQLADDLGLDSLDLAEVLVWLEETYEVQDIELSELVTIGSVIKVAQAGRGLNTTSGESIKPVKRLLAHRDRSKPTLASGNSLAELFLKGMAHRSYNQAVAIGDQQVGSLSWRRVRQATLVLAELFSTLPEKRIGVLLPASSGSCIVLMALQIAEKVPVMLNWTTGTRLLEHSLKVGEVEKIITSELFLDRITQDLSPFQNRFFLLDHWRREINWTMIKGIINSWGPYSYQSWRWNLGQRKLEDLAVILFTSGSEALPKGVPLSNRNIIANIKAALEIFDLESDDCLLGFLPPFHSFGFTITTMLPLLVGLRAVYHPDPGEARRLVRLIENWQVTIVPGTPTFLSGLLGVVSEEQLRSIRLLLSGAERASKKLFELTAQKLPQAKLLEGYGITECAPLVTVNRPCQDCSVGVGSPVPGVKLAFVDPNSHQPVSGSDSALVLVHGDNVFSGYLGEEQASPFVHLEDTQWYNTGDLGFLKDDSLVLTGRLKRFVKTAGERISLEAIEATLTSRLETEVVVVASESEEYNRPLIAVFSTQNLAVDQVNQILRESGFSSLVKVSHTEEVSELPLLGTGKVNWRTLQHQFEKQLRN